MDRLERRVEILERLPDSVTAVESQIVLLRDEMRSEFSAVRADAVETRRVLTERMESLFDANPLENIANTRRINKVYLRGKEVDRAGMRARWQAKWKSS